MDSALWQSWREKLSLFDAFGRTSLATEEREGARLKARFFDFCAPSGRIGQAGRRRVEERFSLEGAVARYSALYQRLYGDKRHNGPTAGAPSVLFDHAGRKAGQPEARVR